MRILSIFASLLAHLPLRGNSKSGITLTHAAEIFFKMIPANNRLFPHSYPKNRAKKLLTPIVLSLCIFGTAHAATDVWQGVGSTSWFTSANWSLGLPNPSDVAQFGATGTATQIGIAMSSSSTNNGTANEAVGAIDITSARAHDLTLQNSSSTTSGTLTLNGATVTLNDSSALSDVIIHNGSSENLTIANGMSTMNVALADTTNNIVSLEGTGNITITSAISGNGKLTKAGNGSGVFTLSGSNTYSGGTTLSAGTLLINNSSGSATGTGAVTVSNSGTLTGTGFADAGANNITINGVLSPGTAAAAGNPGTIHLASTAGVGALTLSSTSTLMFDLGTSQDLVALTSTGLSLGGGGPWRSIWEQALTTTIRIRFLAVSAVRRGASGR